MKFETKDFKRIILLCIIIIAIAIGLNILFPLTFSAYFLICILSLLMCKLVGDNNTLVIPWTITAVASVIITLNYLHPDISVYTNADYHTLVMQGVDKKDSVLLIGKNKAKSFFDNEKLEGYASITHQNRDNANCLLHFDLQGTPLFSVVEKSRTGRLLNKMQLPSFRNSFSIENDSVRCNVLITTFPKDSIHVDVSFSHLKNDLSTNYRPSFKQPIRIGYNLYDMLHSGVSYEESEETLLSVLRDVVIVRDYDEKDVYYMTYPRSMKKLQLVCDGSPFLPKKGLQTVTLDQDTYFYIGLGSKATRPMRASYEYGNVCLRYRFPYINNFPSVSGGSIIKENEQKIVAVTSKTASLMKANVNEAFYYPLFENEKNEYHFNGNVNYRINNSLTAFKATLTDDHQIVLPAPNTLTTKNGAVWHFRVCNLRQVSPITGEDNIYVKDTTIIGLVFILLLLAFVCSMLLTRGHTSMIMMMVWLFAIPLLVMRIYLLWRIAVFPPVTDITLDEFLRYRMELPNLLENPELVMFGLWLFALIILIIGVLIKHIIVKDGTQVQSVVEKIVPQKIHNFFQDWGHHILFFLILLVSVVTVAGIKFTHTNIVGLNILVPVILFLINEYVVARWLSVGYRITNAVIALAALFLSDPGYAIMFFIFECVYYAIILYAFLKCRWREYSSRKAAGFYFFCVLLLAIGATVVLLPIFVSWSYSSNPSILGFVSTSRLMFFVFPLVVGGILLFVIWRWHEFKSTKGYLCVALPFLLAVTIASTIWGYDYYQTHNLHFKYRAIIHTQKVGEIMQDERYGEDDAQRLLNAAQNQWFLQYHINKGAERITENGIMSLSPHFKKGVTWNTQISDVILSRYIIGELSGIVPLFMILLSVVFLWIVFQNENKSPAGRALTFAIALLFLVQSTFEWMAVTNRTVFFGQDFPFMSQNARFTLYMFGIWLMLLVFFACYVPKKEFNEELEEGLEEFVKPFPRRLFFGFFALVVGVVFAIGNNYEKLYADDVVEGDKSNAEEFNVATAMNKSNYQLSEINVRLSEYPADDRKLENGEDISSLVQDIEDKIHLSQYVEKMKEDGRINDFTYSLYQAFITNLKRKNSNGNIIHLRHEDMDSYELALNKTFFNLQSPDLDKKAWKGSVYSDVASPVENKTFQIASLPGLVVYSIPRLWLPSNIDYAVVDCRVKDGHIGENYDKVIHKEMDDYRASVAVFPVSPQDLLELNDKKTKDVLTYQYGREEQSLLVKNMMINGKHKFFYPLKEKCLWLRDFSNLVAFSKRGAGNRDSVFVTLDSKLTESLSDSLKLLGVECSVVAIDGWGNVRLMVDNKLSGSIDPNNEDLLNELAVQSYMNPNSETDQNLFGNLNLCYLKPGPGSSLKPITYAAVTSQSQDIEWARLELMSPMLIKDTTVSKVVGKYYHLRKYGPKYKYSAKRPFKSLTSDEEGGKEHWINNDFYLYKSSNYYNALITYLGHYDNLGNAINNIFVVSTDINDYPRFRMEKGGQIYTFKGAPKTAANQILFDGLTKNFRMPTFTGFLDTLRYEFVSPSYYRKNNVESKLKLSNNFPWVFPQASTIYDYEMRNSELTPAERLRQYTLGASPVKVTPVKMAEMYGKLYSLHPDFHATVIPHREKFIEPWLDRNGDATNNYFSFYRENLFNGMASCVQKGTADYLGKVRNGYYLYAKTGTLSLREGVSDDRMLAVIICNKDIINDGRVESPDDYKFMVVYFRFKQCEMEVVKYQNTIKSILNEIMHSNSFKNYMR